MPTYTLYTSDDEPAVPNITATPEEMLMAVEAANTKQSDTAPHYAVSEDGDRIETDATMDESVVDRALQNASE